MKSKGKISTVQRTIIEIKIHKTISFRVGCFRCFQKKKTRVFGHVEAIVNMKLSKNVNVFINYSEKSQFKSIISIYLI